MTHRIEKGVWYIAGFLAIMALGLWIGLTSQKTYGSAPIGLPAQMATSSIYFLSAGVNSTIAEADRTCSSRVISTGGSIIMLRFATSSSSINNATSTSLLNGVSGHQQAASTTVAYDSGIYGCDYIGAYSFTNSIVTVTKF